MTALEPATGPARGRRRALWEAAGLAVVLLLAAALRLWALGDRPGFDWDEPVYAQVGASLAHGDGLYAKSSFGVPQEWYLFHPPFYFYLLAGWFKAFGASIASARGLAASASLISAILLYVLLRRRWGAWALLPLAVVVTDGWLLFTNRVSWIENTMLVPAVAGLVVYDRAVRTERTWHYAAAGALLGFTAVYKHVGAYLLLAVAVHWLLTRGRRRGHVVLFGTVAVVLVLYVAAAILFTQRHGHNAFLDDSRVQLERLTGQKASRGSIEAGGALDALTGPYKVFWLTLALTAAGGLAVVARAVQAAWRRSAGAIADPLLFSWALAAIVSFAALRLKMGHYFMMVELPVLLYLLAEVVRVVHRRGALKVAVGLTACLVLANLGVFVARFVARDDNALAAVAAYAAAELPPDALVLTEESVGSAIPQPYCKLVKVGACYRQATYLVIYRSATQAPPSTPRLEVLIRNAVPLRTFTGFKERITVYRSPGSGPACAGDRIDRGACAWSPELPRRLRELGNGPMPRVRTGPYTALVTHEALRPLSALPTPDAPAVIALGSTADGRAVFSNVSHARVTGDGTCRPSRRACHELVLRAGDSAHLEVPAANGDTIGSELKVDGLARPHRRGTPSRAGAALVARLRAAAARPLSAP